MCKLTAILNHTVTTHTIFDFIFILANVDFGNAHIFFFFWFVPMYYKNNTYKKKENKTKHSNKQLQTVNTQNNNKYTKKER